MGHETVIDIPSMELQNLNNGCQTSLDDTTDVATGFETRSDSSRGDAKVSEGKEDGKSCVVDVKYGDEEVCEGERVCRICHLSNEQELKGSWRAKTELIKLECSCNGELSFAHSYCAEAWFKLKGNRICEICGQMVSNVRGVGNDMFMEEWVENGGNSNSHNSSERAQEGCWHRQPLCNFVMACLVIAFVVPWFFHINIF